MQMWQILNHIQLRLFSSTTTPKSSSRPLCHHKEIINRIKIENNYLVGDFINAITLHFFFINIPWSYSCCPYCSIRGNIQIPPSTARILKLLMIQSNVYVGDLQSRLYFPPYLWWMSEISPPSPSHWMTLIYLLLHFSIHWSSDHSPSTRFWLFLRRNVWK